MGVYSTLIDNDVCISKQSYDIASSKVLIDAFRQKPRSTRDFRNWRGQFGCGRMAIVISVIVIGHPLRRMQPFL